MPKTCPITEKSAETAGKYSNRVRATQYNPTGKRKQSVNFQKKQVYIPELEKQVTLEVSTDGLKTIRKKGASKALREAGLLEEVLEKHRE